MEPLISVIVPVYNVGAYVEACLESIVNQTYDNLEIIVVDDGSTDDSGNQCDRWAERDERIRVIHQPNGGLSAARNTGLDAMHGENVMMVDSDDVLHPAAARLLLDAMHSSRADVVVGGYTPFVGDGPQWPAVDRSACEISVYDQQQAMLAIFYQHRLTHSAWARLYRSSLFAGIRYPVGLYYEDLAVIYPLVKKCSLIAQIDTPVYGYRQREHSILATFSPKRADVIDILEELEKKVLEQDQQYVKAVRSRLLSAYFNILILSSQDRVNDHAELQQRCWQGIKRLRNGCLTDSHVRLKNKLGIVASWAGRGFLTDMLGRNYHPAP